MPNQTSNNNKATSNIVYFRNRLQSAIESGDCCFSVVNNQSELDSLENQVEGNLAIIWDRTGEPTSITAIAIYLGDGSWLVKSLKGDKGTKGDKGNKGDKGEKGNDGVATNGTNGTNGVDGVTPDHQWTGTKLQFKKPDGSWGTLVDLKGDKGEKGLKGDNGAIGARPDHEWDGYSIRFTSATGDWGEYVNLRGANGSKGDKGEKGEKGANGTVPSHQLSTTENAIRFELPSGEWGEWVQLGSSSSGANGIENLILNVNVPAGTSYDTIENVIATMTPYTLPEGKMLHVTWNIPKITTTVKVFTDQYPRIATKWWYRGKGLQKFGSDTPYSGPPNRFFCYFNSDNYTVNGVSPKSVYLDDMGPYFKDMAYLEMVSTFGGVKRKTLHDFMKQSEQLAISNMMNAIKLKFSWGNNNFDYEGIIDQNPSFYEVGYTLIPKPIYGRIKVNNLMVEIPNFAKFAGLSPELIIDRYKGTKRKGGLLNLTEGSKRGSRAGFKHHRVNPSITQNLRTAYSGPNTEIPITERVMSLSDSNWVQHRFFKIHSAPDGNLEHYSKFILVPKGIKSSKKRYQPNASQNMQEKQTSIIVRFRIRWCSYDERGRRKFFTTSESGKIRVTISSANNPEESDIQRRILSYEII